MAASVIQTTGLIIKEMKVGENDRLVTVLTSDLGVIRAFCRGSLKSASKNAASTAFLTYSRLNIYKGRDTYKINDATAEKIFWELRSDFSLLSLASYFCEVSAYLAPADEPAPEFLRLVLNCLHLLNRKDGARLSPDAVKAVFELRCCMYAGYMPDISGCHRCGGELSGSCLFDIANGVFYCRDCAKGAPADAKSEDNGSEGRSSLRGEGNGEEQGSLPAHPTPNGGFAARSSSENLFERRDPLSLTRLPSSAAAAMRHILYSTDKQCFGFRLSEQSLSALGLAAERFLQYQTGRQFDTLSFYKTYSL